MSLKDIDGLFMTEKYRVHDWVKFDYSEIKEYVGDLE